MKKLSKAQKARNGRKRKPRTPELYFVIGGGINRTKCATMAEAETHATNLLRGQLDSGKIIIGVDAGASNGDDTALVMATRERTGWQVRESITIPKIERAQCLGSAKPLYIVKVVGVAELVPPPVKVRAPRGDELA